ncbi:ATP-dependent RNA helicase-like protein DB10 isoform X2 [Phalaenopsis equestris]|uniref:ATP-dependent RNA helicase-like protein DB10 isoform X2 n=1 Tax=Phalaenopsis equestris TaxID=78828 RepID=UPI0009E54EA4|nr:ATP-dependent RNA helicase-like protein DB10 isoform X2 [Phalaenopsis equestris]
MAATATGSQGSGPRYAPEDPTLPKPWKGLVDGSTGYLYYWNPVTNVTQYERPAADEHLPPPPPLLKLAPLSSVQVHQRHHEEDGRSRSHQHQGVRVSGVRSGHGSTDVGHGSSGPHSYAHGSVHSRSIRSHGALDAGLGLSAEAYRRHNEITVTGDDIPAPYMTFESAGFAPEILKEVHRAGFSCPTPIQAQSWPIALQGHDIVAIAKTGSGKTIGYLFPGFVHLKRVHNNSKMGPTVLVLSPTRELATQIQVEAEKFGRTSRISCTCLYGGAPKGPQLKDLDRGVDIVVATPGRLNDILEMRRISLRQVSYLVLDEADRMLDMGFEPQIRKIVKEVPHCRQTLMFTATWPKEVRKIAADLLSNPIQVNIGNIDELVANNAITQYVELIRPMEKQRRLEQILRSQETGSKIIIFCTTKRMCDQLARSLVHQFGAAAIHGDKSQVERDRVLNQFKTGRSPILVATDVAARGLDIKDIRVVINYDFPTGVEDYVHRIGRTGRAGATGVSYTFFSDNDSKYALELVKVLEGADQRVPPELRDMAARGGFGGKSRRWGSDSSARDRGRFGAGRNDSTNVGRSWHVLSSSSRIVADHDRSNYGRDRDVRVRYNRLDGHALDKHPNNDARGILRGRSHSYSPSPSPRRGHGLLNNGHSRSRSRSRSNTRSRSRSRSSSIGRSNKRLRTGGFSDRPSPKYKRKDLSVDHHHEGQSPPWKQRETSNDRHLASPPRKIAITNNRSRSRSRSRSIERSNGSLLTAGLSGRPSSPYKRKNLLVDHHHEGQLPPQKRRETSNDRHHSSPPRAKKEISVDHPRGPSPRKKENSIDHDRRPPLPRSKRDNLFGRNNRRPASPRSNWLNSADEQDRSSSLPKNESLAEHHPSPSPLRQGSQSPCNQTENGSGRELDGSEQLRRSPPHHVINETEPDLPRTAHEFQSRIESGKLADEPERLASAPENGEEEEEGLILPDESPEHVPGSRDN